MASTEALSDFNRAVSDWSNQFAPELRKVAYIIGSRMGWDHNEFQIAWSSLQRHYEKSHGETITENTLKKYARLWAAQGGLKIVANYRETNGAQLKKDAPGRRGKDGKRVGTRGGARMNTDASNTFAVDFNTVVKARRVPTGERGRPVTEYWAEPWDFGKDGRGATDLGDCLTPQLPLNPPTVTPYSPLDSSEYSSAYSFPDGEGRDEEPQPGKAEKPGTGNTYLVRTYKSGKQVYARLDRAHHLAVKGDFSVQAVRLSDEEASWLWTAWPAVSPEPPETRAARIGYLLASPGERAALMEADRLEEEAEAANVRRAWDDARQREADLIESFRQRLTEYSTYREVFFKDRLDKWRQAGRHPDGHFTDVYPDDLPERLERYLGRVATRHAEQVTAEAAQAAHRVAYDAALETWEARLPGMAEPDGAHMIKVGFLWKNLDASELTSRPLMFRQLSPHQHAAGGYKVRWVTEDGLTALRRDHQNICY